MPSLASAFTVSLHSSQLQRMLQFLLMLCYHISQCWWTLQVITSHILLDQPAIPQDNAMHSSLKSVEDAALTTEASSTSRVLVFSCHLTGTVWEEWVLGTEAFGPFGPFQMYILVWFLNVNQAMVISRMGKLNSEVFISERLWWVFILGFLKFDSPPQPYDSSEGWERCSIAQLGAASSTVIVASLLC